MKGGQKTKGKSSKAAKTKKQLPNWAKEPFRRFLDHHYELDQILHLSIRGISVLRGMPQSVEALAALERELDGEDKDWTEQMEAAKREADLAEREVDRGFPLLHSQAVITLCASLEDLLRTFLATWLANEPSAKQVDSVSKLKISLGEYESTGEEERCFYIAELLERELRSPLRQGVSRFESLLEPFGLSGDVDEEIQKNMYEMFHVRNVLVHRRGLADRRLIEACPWLGLAVGDPVIVSHDMYVRYSQAVTRYVLELIQRVRVYFGLGRYKCDEVEAETANGRTPPCSA